jgi:hypothetical protein
LVIEGSSSKFKHFKGVVRHIIKIVYGYEHHEAPPAVPSRRRRRLLLLLVLLLRASNVEPGSLAAVSGFVFVTNFRVLDE